MATIASKESTGAGTGATTAKEAKGVHPLRWLRRTFGSDAVADRYQQTGGTYSGGTRDSSGQLK